jgi:hypothetical protein
VISTTYQHCERVLLYQLHNRWTIKANLPASFDMQIAIFHLHLRPKALFKLQSIAVPMVLPRPPTMFFVDGIPATTSCSMPHSFLPLMILKYPSYNASQTKIY